MWCRAAKNELLGAASRPLYLSLRGIRGVLNQDAGQRASMSQFVAGGAEQSSKNEAEASLIALIAPFSSLAQ